MPTYVFLLCLATVLDWAVSDDMVYNIFDSRTKAKLCAAGKCTLKSEQVAYVEVKWTFGGAAQSNPQIWVDDPSPLLIKDRKLYLCKPDNTHHTVTATSQSTCKAGLPLQPGTWTFQINVKAPKVTSRVTSHLLFIAEGGEAEPTNDIIINPK